MNSQDPVGSYRILENPIGSCIGFLPGLDSASVVCNGYHFFSQTDITMAKTLNTLNKNKQIP